LVLPTAIVAQPHKDDPFIFGKRRGVTDFRDLRIAVYVLAWPVKLPINYAQRMGAG